MGTFTLSQTRTNNNLYLWVNSTVCTGNISDWKWNTYAGCPIGCDCRVRDLDCYYNSSCYGIPNEDPNNPNDNTSIYAHKLGEELILFGLEDHIIETGNINYIEVVVRAKTEQSMSEDDEFYIIVSPNSDCSDYYTSDDIDLTTTFRNYSKIYTENPETSERWTWSEINNLSIGLKSNLTYVTKKHSLTILPDGDVVTELERWGKKTHYDCVRDFKSAYFIFNNMASYKYDSFTFDDHTTETGSISKVTLFAWVLINSPPAYFKLYFNINGNDYYYDEYTLEERDRWVLYTKELTVNPDTSIAWTWNDIDNLIAGISINGWGFCKAMYITVNYEVPDYIATLRVSQEYIRVNYSSDFTCTLTKPEKVSASHSNNIKMLNFWNGEREVYSLDRASKILVLKGNEYSKSACSDINCIRQMGMDGSNIDISGLNMYIFNSTFKIRSFGWKAIIEKPEYYEWILELEYAT